MEKQVSKLAKKYNFRYGSVNEFTSAMLTSNGSRLAALNIDPRQVLPNVASVIVLTFGFNKVVDGNLAAFAIGSDYHKVVLNVLQEVAQLFSDSVCLVDSPYLNDRYFANAANLGYIGKNSMFIDSEFGSYCYIGLILTSSKVSFTNVNKRSCKSCSRCLEACPTNALASGFNARRCIAELLQDRSLLEFDFTPTNIYGCDLCQLQCPHNHHLTIGRGKEVVIDVNLTKSEFKKYANTNFYWLGYRTIYRNMILNNLKYLSYLKTSNSKYLQEVYKVLKG